MERINLTKNEKKTLRGLALGNVYPPDGVSKAAWYSALRSLQRHGLVKASFVEGGSAEDAKVTINGKEYLREFPSLRNPVDWEKMTAILLLVAVAIFAVRLVIKLIGG